MTPVDKEIGRLIRKAREHMKLAPEDVSEELGISTDQLLRMEFGELRPSPYQLLSLCAVLRVQPSWFFPDGWNGGNVPHAQSKKDSDPLSPASAFSGDETGIPTSRRPIEINFPGGIRVVVGRDFDRIALSRVVEVLRAT